MPVEDMHMTRRVQRELGKRVALDTNLVTVRSIHGVVYVNGRVRAMRAVINLSLEDEMAIVAQNIKRIPGVRDVVMEVSYG